MSSIIKGSDMSNYVTIGITLATAKKENNDGVKQKYAVFTAQDVEGGFAAPIRHIMFEDEIGTDKMTILAKYIMLDDTGNKVKDAKGGYPIDMKALKASSDVDQIAGFLKIPGGMVMEYQLQKGECYANDVDGNRVKNKSGQDVTKRSIPVFVQVKFFMVDEQGKMIPNFANRMGLNERGSRIEAQFYKEAVGATTVVAAPATGATATQPAENNDPF